MKLLKVSDGKTCLKRQMLTFKRKKIVPGSVINPLLVRLLPMTDVQITRNELVSFFWYKFSSQLDFTYNSYQSYFSSIEIYLSYLMNQVLGYLMYIINKYLQIGTDLNENNFEWQVFFEENRSSKNEFIFVLTIRGVWPRPR